MRILILADYLWVGGAERATVLYARVLRDVGHEVHVHLMLGGEGAYRAPLERTGARVTSAAGILESLSAVPPLVEEWRPDAVLVNDSATAMVLCEAMAYRLPPIGVVLHAATDWYRDAFLADDKPSVVAAYYGVSAAICEWVQAQGIPEDKIHRVRNLVDAEEWSRGPAALLPLPVSTVLGYVGRIAPEKGPSLILRCARHAREMGHDVGVVLVGGADERAGGAGLDAYRDSQRHELDEVELEVERWERDGHPVHWTRAAVDDVRGYLSGMDYLVLASSLEGLPYAAVEAMACGVPVVAPAMGDLPELVEGCGLLYQPQPGVLPDAWHVTEAIRRAAGITGEARDRLSRAARQRVVEGYSVQEQGAALAAALLAPLAGSGTQPRPAPEEDAPVRVGLVPRTMRPRVLVVYDSPGWALHRIALQVQRHLADEYDVDHAPYWPPRVVEPGAYDLVLLLTYMAAVDSPHGGDAPSYPTQLPDAPVITAVYCRHLWIRRPANRAAMGAAAARSSMLLASCDSVATALHRVFPHHRHGRCEDGVDLDLFQPQPPRLGWGLVVGWAGTSDTSVHGDVKGLDLIRAAVDRLPYAELRIQDREVEHIQHAEMPAWYAGINVYVCASRYEGTPNPILEASASARPWVSTDVGIVGQLYLDGMLYPGGAPGIIVPRTVPAIARALDRLYHVRLDGDPLGVVMGRRGRAAVEAAWSWSDRAEQFRRAFRRVLG